MSESEEMYLVSIARLKEDGAEGPVSLSRLAERLSVQPVSVNQMVRKLEEAQLVTYTPYKGVELTAEGEQRAARILRSRRLWEVFLVEKLNYLPQEADEIACRLEHVVPVETGERLSSLLGNPGESPLGKPIPVAPESAPRKEGRRLSQLHLDQDGVVIQVRAEEGVRAFLKAEGVCAGTRVTVLASGHSGDTLIRTCEGNTIHLSAELAEQIWVREAL